jgi:hypothetical protein
MTSTVENLIILEAKVLEALSKSTDSVEEIGIKAMVASDANELVVYHMAQIHNEVTALVIQNNKLTEATKAMALYILDKNIGTQEEVENFLKHIENTDSWIINPNKSAE